jgi:hypothetical protein
VEPHHGVVESAVVVIAVGVKDIQLAVQVVEVLAPRVPGLKPAPGDTWHTRGAVPGHI